MSKFADDKIPTTIPQFSVPHLQSYLLCHCRKIICLYDGKIALLFLHEIFKSDRQECVFIFCGLWACMQTFLELKWKLVLNEVEIPKRIIQI